MKNLYIILTVIFLSSCTEVVDIKLDTANPKLVVEASINWQKGTAGNIQKIILTSTADYYTNKTPVVSNATVTVSNSLNVIFNFIEIPNTGQYVCNNFIPVLNEKYKLTIVSNGKTYTGTENLKPIAEITTITQNNNGGISSNEIQVNANFLDPAATEDFYLFKYEYPSKIKPDIYVTEDTFYNGNPFFSQSFNNDAKVGDTFKITHYGVSKQYYKFLEILLNISGQNGGGPFQSPPVTVRGNVLNQTSPDDFPFGYFSLSETDFKTYTVQ